MKCSNRLCNNTANQKGQYKNQFCNSCALLVRKYETKISQLNHNMCQLIPPIQEFINKVESGRAHSVDSYRKFKNSLNNIKL